MPPRDRYESIERYYETLFHELGHSTGHEKRLDRKLSENKCKEKYGQEELIAEFTSAFLCHEAGIETETVEQTAAYLAGWAKVIKADPKAFATAAGAAQKAADMILGKSATTEKKTAQREAVAA